MTDPYEALREFFPDLHLPTPPPHRSPPPVTVSARPSTSRPPDQSLSDTFPPSRVPTRPQRPRARRTLFNEPKFSETELFHISRLFITRCDSNTQISCMVAISPSVLSFSEIVPIALRATQKKLLDKLQEKNPNKEAHLTCIRVDHPQLTANHEMFVHLKPGKTDLGEIILRQIERCLNSDRKVNFEESFRVVLTAHFR